VRLFRFFTAAVLLVSSVVLAQHGPRSAPASPPPAPSPSRESSSSNLSGSSGSYHSIAPSSPASSSNTSVSSSAPGSGHASSTPNSAPFSAPSPGPGHARSTSESPSSSGASSTPAASGSRVGEHAPEPGRIVSESKTSGDGRRMVSSPRTGETPTVEPPPKPAESDLRRAICLKGPCAPCPPGQMPGKNGTCVVTPQIYSDNRCSPEQVWNGSSCVADAPCPMGEHRAGNACLKDDGIECLGINLRAAALTNEVRGAKANMRSTCTADPSAQDCKDWKLRYGETVQRYRALIDLAPINCRAGLLDPFSL
jgi:hypothetical protein